MKKGLLMLSIVVMSTGLVACGGGEAKANIIPQYIELEARGEVSIEGYDVIDQKIYDINNDGLFDEITIGKKDLENKLFIETAEKGELLNVVELEEGANKIKEIRDSDNDGIEEIIIEGVNGDKEYIYDSTTKGFVLK